MHKRFSVILPSTIFLIVVCVFIWANLPNKPLPVNTHADFILVEKSLRKMTLYNGSTVLKKYRIALGNCPVGDKQREGDKKTPEGIYTIDRRKLDSAFTLALHISYPDQLHTRAARRNGVSPGGDIMIHGMRNGLGWIGKLHSCIDWTAGCIAVSNNEIREIARVVKDGTKIEIRP